MAIQTLPENSSAAVIARFLKARGVKRVYALCGGHIMPMWMQLHQAGIQIIDVRDERAAVYMAHAEAQLSGGFGVAMVTAGPGMTNAMTGIANAHTSRVPVLVISGVPPRSQENRGALQDMRHTDLVRPITRYARTVRQPELVLQELDEAVSCAMGHGGEPGPVYIDFPVDTQRGVIPPALLLQEHFTPKQPPRTLPEPSAIQKAVELLWSAKRPLVITGRGAMGAGKPLAELLSRLNAAYLDTGESKGLISEDHPSVVAAMRGSVMGQSDLVITIGRKLDFQLAYGSPAVFGKAKFLRISDCASEIRDNRRGDVELLCNPELALQAILDEAGDRQPATEQTWTRELRAKHCERSEKLYRTMQEATPGTDGLMHPNRLLAALRAAIPKDSVIVADGGDFLSFARVGLPATTYLDPGSLGCIGIGTPFGIAASLNRPDQTVVVATGDGSFGFNAMEIDSAVRHKAPVLICVANNGSWAIEVTDQRKTHGTVAGTHLQFSDYAAMARSFGMHAERVEKPEDLPAAIERALANRPALLDVLVTPEAVSSDAKSGLAWVPDLQPLAVWNEAEKKWREE
ncbi:thiamine pyrophosphate-binding protein [Marinobacter sp.]|uniref:thiamine pyrophosphate-binding protein n=1 Tax=Marinobacter sp. TaxID=50741 RepID=UPI0023577B05|nr:thiamine pyrophosphate-binding protein [Marinobacter sp.]